MAIANVTQNLAALGKFYLVLEGFLVVKIAGFTKNMTHQGKNFISVRGAEQNNLKRIDVDIPLNQMTVVSGVSGSGKSSFVFDTVYAEGQRRYIETFSPYARQFFDRMDKAKVESIDGIPPAIAIEQGNNVKTSRSTVGTLTEIADYLKLLFANLAEPWSPETGERIIRHTPDSVWKAEFEIYKKQVEILILFPVLVPDKIKFSEVREILAKQGYRRAWLRGRVEEIEGLSEKKLERTHGNQHGEATPQTGRQVVVVQDRIKISQANRSRFIESVEAALQKGQGWVWLADATGDGDIRKYTSRRICPETGRIFPEPMPSLFSFNNPHGACPACRGFGRTIEIDYDLAIPDKSLSIRGGAIKPFMAGHASDCRRDVLRYCERAGINADVPFRDLSERDKRKIIAGDPKDPGRTQYGPWYGVKGYFEWLETKSYKMHIRVLLSRYRIYRTCATCGGTRFQPETLYYRLEGKNLGEINQLPVSETKQFFLGVQKKVSAKAKSNDPIAILFREIIARLGYLEDVGLGYLTLNRAARTLSGGEVQRVHLTSCLGSAMVNTLFVLDEPSVGLHARDVASLVRIMHRLRDNGNTLLVVEHDSEVIRSADHLVDLGPGAGEHGGKVVYAGPPLEEFKVQSSKFKKMGSGSLTLDYLSGRSTFLEPRRRSLKDVPRMKVVAASQHNLQGIDAEFPLKRLVCVTGVSGSGKSTLVHEVLYKNIQRLRGRGVEEPGRCQRIEGLENLGEVVLVDQSPIGRTPRSNPVVYVGAYDFIRQLYAGLPESIRNGFTAGTFSFNAGDGRCPRCGGSGRERVEMQFLSDVFLPCPECDGKRFQPDVLKIRYQEKNISELFDLTVDEALLFFGKAASALHEKILSRLKFLQRVGLGYLRLGQGVNTLSGGEAQRLKLVGYLSERGTRNSELGMGNAELTNLLIFDEPTTGLHAEDVRKLLEVFQDLVDAGNSLMVIEHHLEVIRAADWILDLGPEAGDQGGKVVGAGPPERIAQLKTHTGIHLRGLKKPGKRLSKAPSHERQDQISIVGAREHNLKNLKLEIPRDKMVVITGVSGSGKSTLAFDLLFSEGQRRFLDCMSAYARQYVEQLSRPDVDLVAGLPPSVAIEQRVTRGGWKSTVATVTEVYHFIRLLYARAGVQYCPESGVPVIQQSAAQVMRQVEKKITCGPQQIGVPMIRDRKGFHTEIGQWAIKRGYRRMRVDGQWIEARKFRRLDRYVEHDIDVVTGSLAKKTNLTVDDRRLIQEALEFGKGSFFLVDESGAETVLSTERYSPATGRSFTALDPKDFSFNSPRGWCPRCHGYGVLWPELDDEEDGEEMKIESKDFDSAGAECPECAGTRLKKESLHVRIGGRTIGELVRMPVSEAGVFFRDLKFTGRSLEIARDILPQIIERLAFLDEVGLGYLEMGRSAVTLSGGESQRIRLAAQLGSNLRGVLYVLDEPTIGLHASDNEKLLDVLRRLRSRGNSLVVVEHDEDTMRQADWLIDMGPGAGKHGGEIVWAGDIQEALRRKPVLGNGQRTTLEFLHNPMVHPVRGKRRALGDAGWLVLEGAQLHNLKDVTARIPHGRLTVVSGVSGSGKSSLIRECLKDAVAAHLLRWGSGKHWRKLSGVGSLKAVYEVDQSPIGKTPRSCPATYLGIFSLIRSLLSQTSLARMRGYGPGRFSFNAAAGRCAGCEGQGRVRLRMNFLPDVYVSCGDCGGRRFNAETLDVTYRDRTIADILEMTVEEAAEFFSFSKKISLPLRLMNETGLGYLALGQSSPTLSGGEAQRLKLVSELMRGNPEGDPGLLGESMAKRNLYILEEPTIGLHFSDVRRLIDMLHRLVDLGHTVVVIEHHLDLIAEADYVLDLGPGGGGHGGRIVASGTPEEVAAASESKTGRFLKKVLPKV